MVLKDFLFLTQMQQNPKKEDNTHSFISGAVKRGGWEIPTVLDPTDIFCNQVILQLRSIWVVLNTIRKTSGKYELPSSNQTFTKY